MKLNNIAPRLCGFIVSAFLATIVFISTWNAGIDCDSRIQFVVASIVVVWGILLVRARGWKDYKVYEIITIIVVLALLALFFSIIWHEGYLSNMPLLQINSGSGGMHRDTLYHSALTSSIENYGYSSLLVNSKDFHNYHFGSHIIFALISRLFGILPIFTYCYLYPVIFFPLYASLLLYVAIEIRNRVGIKEKLSWIDVVVLFCFVSYAILPEGLMRSLAIFKNSFIDSESFCVANTLGLAFIYLWLRISKKSYYGKKSIRIFFLLIIVPFFVVFISLCKISVGLILTFMICYYLFRKKGINIRYLFLEVFYAIVFLGVYFVPRLFYSPIQSGTSETNGFVPLHYIKAYVADPGFWGLHIIVLFSFSFVYIFYRLKEERFLSSLVQRIKEKRMIAEEMLFFVCILGALPGMLIAIGGGSAFYFVSIQQLIAVTLLIGYNIPKQILRSMSIGKKIIYKIASVFIVICCFFNTYFSSAAYARNLINDSKLRAAQYAESLKDNTYWSTIKRINALTDGHKDEYYIYVCDSAKIWNKYGDLDCALFFYPAMTGVVCVGELFTEGGSVYTNNGVKKQSGYTFLPSASDVRMTKDDAYEKAKKDGKKAVIYIFEDTMSVVDIEN